MGSLRNSSTIKIRLSWRIVTGDLTVDFSCVSVVVSRNKQMFRFREILAIQHRMWRPARERSNVHGDIFMHWICFLNI